MTCKTGKTGKTVCASMALVAGLLAIRPVAAAAQGTVNPTAAQFTPSSDHNATNSDGTPVVQSYQLEFYLVGATAPISTNPLGKPTPDGTNTITVNLAPLLIGWPLPGTTYVADVASVGPGGTAKSTLSNTFSFTSLPCVYGLSPTSQSVAAGGGTGSTNVTTGTGCAWTVTSNATWITFTGGSSRTGGGSVAFTVAANTGASLRTGTLTIAGQTFTVSQAGTCGYTLSAASQSVAAGGGTGSTNVTTAAGCAWTVTSNDTWITFTGGSSRTGSGSVNFTVAANTASSLRTGTLTIAGQTFTVSQAGTCGYSLSAASQSVAAGGGTGSTNVTTTTGCAWTITSNATWITFTGGSSRTGSGSVSFTVAANTATALRTGTLTIAGQTFTVSQAGTCGFTLSSASQSVAAGGGTGSTNVTTATGCAWTVTSNATWITFTGSSSRTGSGSVDFTVAANTATAQRTGTLTIAGLTFTVTEAAGAVVLTSPGNFRITGP